MTTAQQYTDEATAKTANLGWINLGWNEAGSGEKTFILLHGAGAGASSFSNFVLNFGPLAERYRVLAVDQPGYGKSDPMTMTEPRNTVNARAVKDLMDHLGIEKASLIGNSMGGATALCFAVDYPDRLDKMVLMGSGGAGATLFGMLPSEGGKALQACYHDQSFETFRKFFDVMLYNGKAVPDEVLRRRAESVSQPHVQAWLASTGVPQRSLIADLPNVKHQALIIHGRNDRVVTPEAGVQLLSLLPNSQLHMFNRCGHGVQYEHADEFNRMVVDFLEHDQPES